MCSTSLSRTEKSLVGQEPNILRSCVVRTLQIPQRQVPDNLLNTRHFLKEVYWPQLSQRTSSEKCMPIGINRAAAGTCSIARVPDKVDYQTWCVRQSVCMRNPRLSRDTLNHAEAAEPQHIELHGTRFVK